MKSKLKLKRAGRKRRAAGWTLLTLGVLVAGVWVASRWRFVSHSSSRWDVTVISGELSVERREEGNGFPGYWSSGVRDPRVRRWQLWWGFSSEPGEHVSRRYAGLIRVTTTQPIVSGTAGILLWPIPLLLWTPAALLLRSGILARRRALTGACPKCVYSLAGLARDTPCPECGKGAGTK